MVPNFAKKEKEKAHWTSSFALIFQKPLWIKFSIQFFPTFTPTKTSKLSTWSSTCSMKITKEKHTKQIGTYKAAVEIHGVIAGHLI